MKQLLCLLSVLLISVCGWGNNVTVDSVIWKNNELSADGKLKMTFVVSWENSWKDLYNYDAVYVFFKFKKKEDTKSADKTARQDWHHLYLLDEGNKLLDSYAADYNFWLCPLSSPGVNYNTGVYIFHRQRDRWENSKVKMEVTWNIAAQMMDDPLTANDIKDGKLTISAHAIEMVYIPRGPFRLGDGVAEKGFSNVAFPLPAKYDILDGTYEYSATSGNPYLAADRMNDKANTVNSAWIGTPGLENRWWVDFGEGVEKKVTYFGVNAATLYPTYYPTKFYLEGSLDPTDQNPDWKVLWEGEGKGNWMMSEDAYPIAKAIKVTHPDNYRSYRIRIEGMNAGYPVVKSIGMSCEPDLEPLLNHTVLVDRALTVKDSVDGLWAHDGTVWTPGNLPATWPNGYKGFYAMKYELSQEQYVSFLNKLNYQQQNNILEGRLDAMKEGDYIFDDRYHATARNGISLATKITGMPAVFACDLDKSNGPNQETDGQNIACNFMNIADMLAYADWACLRPLSEMEYEKMCKRLYPEMPVKNGYAWNTATIRQQLWGDLQNAGTSGEKAVTGNANYGAVLPGPVRVGAFAGRNAGREKAGDSFWGVAELSGNLAEMYYNVNSLGLQVLAKESGSGNAVNGHDTSHGDGSIDATRGTYNGAKNKYWSELPAAMALRGGSFISPESELQVADRSRHSGFFTSLIQRDSTVTFRLGHSVPDGEPLVSWLILENDLTTEEATAADIMVGPTYMLEGNVPAGTDERECTYIWYAAENGGNWKVLDGESNREYYFDKYKYANVDTVVGYDYRFKRKVVTPYADSEASSEHQAVIKGAFAEPVEVFAYSGDTHQVTCNWDASIPKKWGLQGKNVGTLKINETTGVISGLTAMVCNDVTVTLADRRTPHVVYTKILKETVRNYVQNNVNSPVVYTVKLPKGVYLMECWGAGGGMTYSNGYGGYGGGGGYTKGLIALDSTMVFNLYVGTAGGVNTGGWNGGGNSGTISASASYHDGGRGGGASDIRLTGKDLKDRIMVAGGGGGAADAVHGYVSTYYNGGAGGGLTGGAGTVEGGNSAGAHTVAGGGTQTAGGVAGKNYTSYTSYGAAGVWGAGGAGADYSAHTGGGGGGGYYGGGGSSGWYQGGGGGGSSFISGYPGCNAVNKSGAHTGQAIHFSGLFFQSPVMQQGQNGGHGTIKITVQ